MPPWVPLWKGTEGRVNKIKSKIARTVVGVVLCLWAGSMAGVFGADLTLQEILEGIAVNENLIESGDITSIKELLIKK